jgi:alkaline phosphatase D
MKKALLLLLLLPGMFMAQQQTPRNTLKSQYAPFYHGVASGDPLHDRVIIWTRVTPNEVNDVSIDGTYRMSLTPDMSNVVASGEFTTDQSRDYTVKIDVLNLTPATCYYFDFESDGNRSVVGKTRTADFGLNTNVRFAVVSCSNYQHGYFNVYGALAQRNDVHAVLHLGDYIYEYGVGVYSANMADRKHEPVHETITLDDYRLRYSHYRLDTDLQAVHQQYPFICVWDDHESANDAWTGGAQNHTPGAEGPWLTRKNNAIQAYFEWMPIRETAFEKSIYRKIEYGDLVNLYMLDTRLEGRMMQLSANSPGLNNPDRTLLGTEQKNWLKNELLNSTAQWNVIAQQVMMAPLLNQWNLPVNTDIWDGYPAERSELLNYIVDYDIPNVVVLTGDFHTSWANNLPLQNYIPATGENSAGVEFVTTSLSSPSININIAPFSVKAINPHIQWFDLDKRGFLLVDIKPERTQGEWHFNNNVYVQNYDMTFGGAYFVNDQERFLRQASEPSVLDFLCSASENAELDDSANENLTLFGVYPNPFTDFTLLHLGAAFNQKIEISLINALGQTIFTQSDIDIETGSDYFKIYGDNLPAGTYLLQITANDSTKTHWIVKQ